MRGNNSKKTSSQQVTEGWMGLRRKKKLIAWGNLPLQFQLLILMSKTAPVVFKNVPLTIIGYQY